MPGTPRGPAGPGTPLSPLNKDSFDWTNINEYTWVSKKWCEVLRIDFHLKSTHLKHGMDFHLTSVPACPSSLFRPLVLEGLGGQSGRGNPSLPSLLSHPWSKIVNVILLCIAYQESQIYCANQKRIDRDMRLSQKNIIIGITCQWVPCRQLSPPHRFGLAIL